MHRHKVNLLSGKCNPGKTARHRKYYGRWGTYYVAEMTQTSKIPKANCSATMELAGPDNDIRHISPKITLDGNFKS